MPARSPVIVLSGSDLEGPEADLASWAGVDVPHHKEDDYLDLVDGVEALEDFFVDTEHGALEITDVDEEAGDVHWVVISAAPDELRREVREKLVRGLALDLDLSRQLWALVRGEA